MSKKIAGREARPFKFRPVKLATKKNVRKISKKNLTWPQAVKRYPKIKMFGDADRDGKLNMFDCKPFDKSRHGKGGPKYKRGSLWTTRMWNRKESGAKVPPFEPVDGRRAPKGFNPVGGREHLYTRTDWKKRQARAKSIDTAAEKLKKIKKDKENEEREKYKDAEADYRRTQVIVRRTLRSTHTLFRREKERREGREKKRREAQELEEKSKSSRREAEERREERREEKQFEWMKEYDEAQKEETEYLAREQERFSELNDEEEDFDEKED